MREPNVNVAILNDDKINFELHGDYYNEELEETVSGKFTAELKNGKIVISNDTNTYEFDEPPVFIPEDLENESFLIHDVIIGIEFHWRKREKQRFLGSLKIMQEGDKVTAVNILPVEHYLTSVISSEMSATSSLEFLKAHSIISRSWLLAQIEKSKEIKSKQQKYESKIETEEELIKWYDREDHVLYDVCADDHCQRYQGITKAYTDTVSEAVKETSGLILTYDGKICDARFSKACGGIAEAFENVWEPTHHPYLTKVVDYKFEPDEYDTDLTKEEAADKWIRGNPPAFCNTKDENVLSQVLLEYDQTTTDFYRWTVELTQDEISNLIKEKSGIDFGQIKDLVPVERGFSGRLIKLKIVGTKKTLTIGKELEIRKYLSPSHLYSSAFVVDKEDVQDGIPQKFILTGAGWGHGVGLCQIGAAVMGDMGYQFDEILLHYYKGANIERIY
jgi:SpoIID/LytB domain protein